MFGNEEETGALGHWLGCICVCKIWYSVRFGTSLYFAGKPMTPQLISASIGADGKSLDVEWHIISYSPILEYKVQYRNTKASIIFVIILMLRASV
jgi:hypothetical protein